MTLPGVLPAPTDPGGAMPVGLTVRLGAAAEVVSLHAALEAAPLRAGGGVNQFACLEEIHIHFLAQFHVGYVVHAELSEDAEVLVHVLEMPGARPVQLAGFVIAQLNADVAVCLFGLDLRHSAGACLYDGDGVGAAILPEDLGGSYLLSYESVY